MSTTNVQKFIGSSALDLLEALDPEMVRPEKIRTTMLDRIPPDVILRDNDMRRALIKTMRETEILSLVQHLEVDVKDDPYGMLEKKIFRKNSSLEKALFDFFETNVPHSPQEKKHDSVEIVTPERGLFEYQSDVEYQVLKHLNEIGHRVMLHMPTGSGKTRVAMRAVVSHMLEKKDALVIWLAYSEELCEQALEEYTRAWEMAGNRQVRIVRFYRQFSPNLLEVCRGDCGVFLMVGLKKIYEAARSNNRLLAVLGDRTSFVALDEAHQAVAPTHELILSHLAKNKDTRVLGITATPGRTWNEPDVDMVLAEFFNSKKATIGDPSPVNFLIKKGFLARPINRKIDYDARLSDKEIESINRSLDIPDDVLKRLSIDTTRNVRLLEHVTQLLREGHKRIIFFAITIEHARDIATVLSVKGFTAMYVTGKTLAYERTRIINDFKNDDDIPKILCNYGVLTTGFDAPRTSAVVIARPTKSLVLYSQMVGRATRGKNVGGNTKCVVVTVADMDKYGFGAITDAFKNWEDVWN